jgi:hypothetical protein
MVQSSIIAFFGFVCVWIWMHSTHGEYLIGVGSYDMTGPAADVNMMGYANTEQNTAGIHFRLRARTFIVAENLQGPRFVFVNLDAGMASQLLTIKLLQRLKSRYTNSANEVSLNKIYSVEFLYFTLYTKLCTSIDRFLEEGNSGNPKFGPEVSKLWSRIERMFSRTIRLRGNSLTT